MNAASRQKQTGAQTKAHALWHGPFSDRAKCPRSPLLSLAAYARSSSIFSVCIRVLAGLHVQAAEPQRFRAFRKRLINETNRSSDDVGMAGGATLLPSEFMLTRTPNQSIFQVMRDIPSRAHSHSPISWNADQR